MRAQPRPQPLGFVLKAGASDKVLSLGSAPAHADVDEFLLTPDRVYARRPARHLIAGPVSEAEGRAGNEPVHRLELIHDLSSALPTVSPASGVLAASVKIAVQLACN